MLIPFNVTKVVQAAAVLLKLEDRRCMGRMRLLKLLYIADREAIAEFRRPITGDRPFAMKNGPVLSRTYNLIKGSDEDAVEWERYLRSDRHMVLLCEDPGNTKLSKAEIDKLHQVSDRFCDIDEWDISDLTHEFPEWAKSYKGAAGGKGSYAIPLDDLLEAVGVADEKDAMLEQERGEAAFERAFGL